MSGNISTYAGTGTVGFSGDGGSATSVNLDAPAGVQYHSGVVYIADTGNSRICRVSSGTITTIAGTTTSGSGGDGGAATSAQLNLPAALTIDVIGNLFVADRNNNKVREVFK